MDYHVSDRDLILQYLQCTNQQQGGIRELNESIRNLTTSMTTILVEYLRRHPEEPTQSPLREQTDTSESTNGLTSDTSTDSTSSRNSRGTSTTRPSTTYADATRNRRAPIRRAWQERRESSYTPGRGSSSIYTFPTRRRWSSGTRLRSTSFREEAVSRDPPPPPPLAAPESVIDDTLTQDILNQTMRDSPVRIRPSLRQIRSSTRLVVYRDVSGISQTICPIERENFLSADSILQIIHCGHLFREMSLRQHFRNSPRCPLCRYDIRDYIAPLPLPPPPPPPPSSAEPLPGIADPFRETSYTGMAIREEIGDASGNVL